MRVVRGTVPGHATIGIVATFLLVLVVVLVVGGLVYGVVSLLSGDDPGLVPADPDERARPLPNDRSLREDDLKEIRFDVALRGYRMTQVDRMLRRVAYDLGYKDEMIAVLEAEVIALREGRLEDAELLRKAREAASQPNTGRSDGAAQPDNAHGDEASEPGEAVIELGDVADSESSAPEADERPETVLGEDGPDRTDAAAAPPPDLPREGSLRRREPTPTPEFVAPDAPADPDGAAAVDVADRPAHA